MGFCRLCLPINGQGSSDCNVVLRPCFVMCPFKRLSLAIILLRKRELVALLLLCCGCLCSVSLPRQAVIAVFPGHTHLLFGAETLVLAQRESDQGLKHT